MASLTKTYSDDKRAGRVYTPDHLVRRILDLAEYDGSTPLRILDPACGDGQFLVEVVRRILDASHPKSLEQSLGNVHGWDVDSGAIADCRDRLDALVDPLGVTVDWNVRVRNSLEARSDGGLFAVAEEQFDLVIGNPPYVRIQHLSPEDRQLVQTRYRFCSSGSTDLYVAFFELAFDLLAPGGVAAFVTPNTYFHTATAKALRAHVATHEMLRHVVNYGHRQLFPDATTYVAITIASNAPSSRFTYTDASSDPEHAHEVDAASLRDGSVWRFGHEGDALDPERFRPLREIASIHVGLATLADPVFIVEALDETDPDLLRVRTKRFGEIEIERGLLRPVIKGSKVKPGVPCHQGLYIVFPYDDQQRPRVLAEDILAERYPLGYAYLIGARDLLDRRDNGKPNPAAWYAFGRTQALKTSFGPKIIVPPMAKTPTFVVSRMSEATVYSGYFITYDGDLDALADQLSSDRMQAYVQAGSRDFVGGWKGYTKRSFQDFPVDITQL